MSHRTTFRSAETPCRTTRIPSSPVSVAMGSITRAGRKEYHGRIIHHIRAHEHTPPEFGIDAATVQWLTTGYMMNCVVKERWGRTMCPVEPLEPLEFG